MLHEINSKKPNERVINVLSDALNRAKNGDIQNVVIFGSDGDGCTFSQFQIDSYVMPIIGEARLVERDLIDLNCDIRKNVSWECCE